MNKKLTENLVVAIAGGIIATVFGGLILTSMRTSSSEKPERAHSNEQTVTNNIVVNNSQVISNAVQNLATSNQTKKNPNNEPQLHNTPTSQGLDGATDSVTSTPPVRKLEKPKSATIAGQLSATDFTAVRDNDFIILSFTVQNTSNAPIYVAYALQESMTFIHSRGASESVGANGLKNINGEPRDNEGQYTLISPNSSIFISAKFKHSQYEDTPLGPRGLMSFAREEEAMGKFNIGIFQLYNGKIVRHSFSKMVPISY